VEGGSVVAGLGNATARALVFGGRATLALAVPDDAGLGERPLVLRLDGPRHGDPGTASNVSVVQRTVLTAAASPGKPGAPVTLELTALAGGHPLAGVPLSVRVAGQPDGFVVLTDASGKASVPLAYPDAKTDLLVRYAGGASASAALLGGALDPEALAAIAAPRPEGWPIVGATLGAALLAAALVVFAQRRRHPALEALLAAERLISARGPHEADVLACYAVLQDQLVAAGILRGPATTPRALGQALAKAVPLGAAEPMLDRLLTVFERARYSGRAAGPLDRTEAREALRGLRRQLQRQGVAAQAVPA
jgi:hypothetical protein